MQLTGNVNDGVLHGLLATLVMTSIMLTGLGTGMAPMPEPIPKALAELVLGGLFGVTPGIATTLTGMVAHFGYGAVAGVLYVLTVRNNVGLVTGLLWGILLWVLMQVLVLPVIGWGFFGLAETGFPPKIAIGTLVLHLVYGGILGWGTSRNKNP